MEELTEIDDKAVVFKREGTYQARKRARRRLDKTLMEVSLVGLV